MNRKFRPGLLGTGLWMLTLAVVLVGCGEEEEVDPYVYGTLDQVTRGGVISKEFLYEFDTPDFVFAKGNTAIVRNGNHLEVLVGDDIENRAPQLQGKIIGARKFFSPFVWLMATRVKDGIDALSVTELDSVEAPVLPRFTDVKLDDVQGFDISELRWNQKKKIEDMFEAEVQTVGTVHLLPDHQAETDEDDAAATDDAVQSLTPVETPMAWYLQAEKTDAKFKITNVSPELELAFELIQAEGLPFVGGVKFGEVYPFAERKESEVSGPIEVQYVRYASRYLAP